MLKASRRLWRGLATESTPIRISALPNGVRVVTDSTPGHFSALGAYVDAGSRYESDSTSGFSHMLDRMAWKSTANKTGVQMMEDLARLGGNYMCGAQRELVMYQASVFNQDVENMFECIAQTVREPKLADAEVLEARDTVAYEREELVHKHEQYLPEVLHAAAYGHHTLGMPLYGSDAAEQGATRDALVQFRAAHFRPELTVLALVGVDHDRAVDMARTHWGDWAAAPGARPQRQAAIYRGGEIALPFQEPRYANLPRLVHMQVGFETAGILSSDLYALATLQKVLGGGLSFSAGGPGKGMFSRLFRVLNRYPFVENCLAFNHAHSDLGLFGISISCYVDHAEYMAQIVAQECASTMEEDVAQGGISASELQRAKNQLVSSLLMNVESKLAALEDIGRQVQVQDRVTLVHEMVRRIEALTVADVRAVARKVFGGAGNGAGLARPSVVMQGDRAEFGDVEYVLRHFGLGNWDSEMPSGPRDYRA